MKSSAANFWMRVHKTKDGCWNWLWGKNNSGYGTLLWEGRVVCAHRVAAYLSGLVDTVLAPKDRTKGGFILHQCDNTLCCNPEHFKIGTYAENQLEAYARSRRNASKGSSHTNSKLTDEQIRFIRSEYKKGTFYQQELADKFEVSQRIICMIVRKESYKDVE